MTNEKDEVFLLEFNNHGQIMKFEPVHLDDTPPNSSGVFIFVKRIGIRNIKLGLEPENHEFLGIYFLSEKHQIENMIEKFKEKGANYLFFLNASKENSESIIQFVRTSKEWTDKDLIKFD